MKNFGKKKYELFKLGKVAALTVVTRPNWTPEKNILHFEKTYDSVTCLFTDRMCQCFEWHLSCLEIWIQLQIYSIFPPLCESHDSLLDRMFLKRILCILTLWSLRILYQAVTLTLDLNFSAYKAPKTVCKLYNHRV